MARLRAYTIALLLLALTATMIVDAIVPYVNIAADWAVVKYVKWNRKH